MADLSGAIITISGNSYSTIDTSDANGDWHFDHVPAGIYAFSINKAGYGGLKFSNIQFVGNGTLDLKRFYLGRAPRFTVSLSNLSINSYYLKANIASLDPPTFVERSIVVFSHNLSPSPLDSADYAVRQEMPLSISGTPDIEINTSVLHDHGFNSGDTCYAAGFGLGGHYELADNTVVVPSAYSNSITTNTMYTATGPSSNVIQFRHALKNSELSWPPAIDPCGRWYRCRWCRAWRRRGCRSWF